MQKRISLSVLLTLIIICISSCGDKIDLSSPESVAKGFAKALLKNNKDMAVKYYITLDEVKQIGGPIEKFSRGIDSQISDIDRYILHLRDYDWEKFEVDDEEYSRGHKMVVGHLLFIRVFDGEKETYQIGPIGVINIRENIWKIAYIER